MPIPAGNWIEILPHLRPRMDREPDREALINAPKINRNSAENIFQKGAWLKSNSTQTILVFFRKAAHALFDPVGQKGTGNMKRVLE